MILTVRENLFNAVHRNDQFLARITQIIQLHTFCTKSAKSNTYGNDYLATLVASKHEASSRVEHEAFLDVSKDRISNETSVCTGPRSEHHPRRLYIIYVSELKSKFFGSKLEPNLQNRPRLRHFGSIKKIRDSSNSVRVSMKHNYGAVGGFG